MNKKALNAKNFNTIDIVYDPEVSGYCDDGYEEFVWNVFLREKTKAGLWFSGCITFETKTGKVKFEAFGSFTDEELYGENVFDMNREKSIGDLKLISECASDIGKAMKFVESLHKKDYIS